MDALLRTVDLALSDRRVGGYRFGDVQISSRHSAENLAFRHELSILRRSVKRRMARKLDLFEGGALRCLLPGIMRDPIATYLDPFRFLLTCLAGWMNQRQLQAIDYLRG